MIYMNNAATSWPKFPGMGDFMKETLEKIPVHGSRATGNETGQENVDCREELAFYMGISDKNRIVYMENATRALNTALLGFPWRKGDVVLTTASEHNSLYRPLYFLKKKGILDYIVLPVEKDGRINIDAYAKALQEYHPRMAAITHGSNVTGAVNDMETIAGMAKEYHAAVLMDASQTMGNVSVLPEKWQVDMAAFTGHKYLLGPQGTGGLYVSPNVELEPIITGGTGIYSDEDEMPQKMPLHLEAGTQNEQAFAGLGRALQWAKRHPVKEKEIVEKMGWLEEELLAAGAKVVLVKGQRTPVLSLLIDGFSPEEVGDILYGNYDIICRTGLHCAPFIHPFIGAGSDGTVRISLSRFTTQEEMECLIQAVKEIAGE